MQFWNQAGVGVVKPGRGQSRFTANPFEIQPDQRRDERRVGDAAKSGKMASRQQPE